MKFEDLTKEQLWDLRKQIVLNSVFIADYDNAFGFNAKQVSDFFDGYYDYLWELGEEDGKDTHEEVIKYDNPDNLMGWFNCYDDLSWIKSTIAYDAKGNEIEFGDIVIWTDPETEEKAEYEVYDATSDIVKLWAEFGECEALPEECEVIKKAV